jgi:hypothetical protein
MGAPGPSHLGTWDSTPASLKLCNRARHQLLRYHEPRTLYMKKPLVIAILLAAAAACHADSRWCSTTSKGPNDNLFYPPIAKAAQVQGVVVGRVLYRPNGKVENFERVFGPPLLADSVGKQLMQWTIKTDASGDEPCQTLVIAEFRILDDRNVLKDPPTETGASTFRITVEALPTIALTSLR